MRLTWFFPFTRMESASVGYNCEVAFRPQCQKKVVQEKTMKLQEKGTKH